MTTHHSSENPQSGMSRGDFLRKGGRYFAAATAAGMAIDALLKAPVADAANVAEIKRAKKYKDGPAFLDVLQKSGVTVEEYIARNPDIISPQYRKAAEATRQLLVEMIYNRPSVYPGFIAINARQSGSPFDEYNMFINDPKNRGSGLSTFIPSPETWDNPLIGKAKDGKVWAAVFNDIHNWSFRRADELPYMSRPSVLSHKLNVTPGIDPRKIDALHPEKNDYLEYANWLGSWSFIDVGLFEKKGRLSYYQTGHQVNSLQPLQIIDNDPTLPIAMQYMVNGNDIAAIGVAFDTVEAMQFDIKQSGARPFVSPISLVR